MSASAEHSVHDQITQVFKRWGRTPGPGAEPARPLGPPCGVRGLGSWGAEGAAAGPLRPAARLPARFLGALITREQLPRAFCGRAGTGGLGAGGSCAWSCLPCYPRLHPPRAANGAQPAQGLSGVSRPEPISANRLFPNPVNSHPGRFWVGLEAGSGGGEGPGVGSPTLQVSAADAVALATGLGWGHFTNEVLSVRVTVA